MENLRAQLVNIDWQATTSRIHQKGYATISRMLSDIQCEELRQLYDKQGIYRKTVAMERYRFGLGEYKYFDYPLPPLVQTLREEVYPRLVPLANQWMKKLNINRVYPGTLQALQEACHQKNQLKPTPLILKYGEGGYNTLHQDLYGEIYFPFQLVLFLSEPEDDYTGGEFVLTQQNYMAQSQAKVLRPQKGDVLIFTTNFRPHKGNRGYYKVTVKHGVSEIHQGERYTLGIIFHDALS
ncbi:2OG-Fe(II) oxygenase [Rapidithrix thailandica]|uniref:2OG-Fe(II) oxygenase n=1 Tax=Rapidithrix thailandica TaxID=413964 RepID=A0AAW9S3H0_9BACT